MADSQEHEEPNGEPAQEPEINSSQGVPFSQEDDADDNHLDDVFGDLSDEDNEPAKINKKIADDGDDDDNEEDPRAKRPSRTIRSDSDEEVDVDQGGPSGTSRLTEPDASDDDNQDDLPPVDTEIKPTIKRPRISIDLPESMMPVSLQDEARGEKLFYVALPRFMFIENRPFDEATYDGSSEKTEEQILNTIRWRKDRSKKQSNTRLVKWSDNSLGLFIGSNYFEVQENPLERQLHLAAAYRSADAQVELPPKEVDGEYTEKRVEIAVEEDYGPLRSQLSFKAHGKTEKDLRKRMTEIYDTQTKAKVQALQIISTKEDPRALKEKMEEQERLQGRNRKRIDSNRRHQSDRHNAVLTAAALHGDDEDETTDNRARATNRAKSRRRGFQSQHVPENESDSEEEEDPQERIQKAKRGGEPLPREAIDEEMADFIVDDEDDEQEEEEDEEEEYTGGKAKGKGKAKAKTSQKESKRSVSVDDDDDDEGVSKPKAKKSRRTVPEDDEDD